MPPSALSPSTAPPHCPFCAISAAYPPSANPSSRSSTTNTTTTPTPSLLPSPYPTSSTTTTTTAPAHLILSTPHCLAFLDHAPLARGHTLLCVRAHRIKARDLSTAEGASLGRWLGVLGAAVTNAVAGVIAEEKAARGQERRQEEKGEEEGNHGEVVVGDWNIVQNNGVRAAQVVPHVHYHIIPRVEDAGAPNVAKVKSWTVFGKGQREELDEGDAGVLVERIRETLGREVERVRRREGKGSVERLFGTMEEGIDEGGEEGWERRWSKL